MALVMVVVAVLRCGLLDMVDQVHLEMAEHRVVEIKQKLEAEAVAHMALVALGALMKLMERQQQQTLVVVAADQARRQDLITTAEREGPVL